MTDGEKKNNNRIYTKHTHTHTPVIHFIKAYLPLDVVFICYHRPREAPTRICHEEPLT